MTAQCARMIAELEERRIAKRRKADLDYIQYKVELREKARRRATRKG